MVQSVHILCDVELEFSAAQRIHYTAMYSVVGYTASFHFISCMLFRYA